MGYQFQQFDPRPIPAANQKNDAVFELGSVLGIEVTIPALAGRCDMGNIDHHGEGDTSETPSAIEQALAAKLPADGTVLATVRCDADSVGAMAVLANRVAGRYVDTDLVAAIGRFDRLGPAGGDVPDAVVAIARKSADFRTPLAERVEWIGELLAGEDKTDEVTALVAARDAEFATAAMASEVNLHAGGRIAVVVSTHRFATNLGYASVNVVVAMNPEFPMNFRDPSAGTYRKYTVCRYDSHVPVDIAGALAELNELDPASTPENGWGGRGDIGGSPQGVSSDLELEKVLEVVERHLL